jgi:hypothetical protein
MTEQPEEDEVLKAAVYNSGYAFMPIDSLYEALEKMEEYLMYHTGLSKQELSEKLVKLQNLVGEEEASGLGLEEIINWIKAF